MKVHAKPVNILMADDDADDCLLTKEAMEEARVVNKLDFVKDGEELMDYLYHRGNYAETRPPTPGLILLDLNMPKKDGREALREIKSDPKLRHIPIVVLTTSKLGADVVRTYDVGANSYIVKPITFDGMVDIVKSLKKYWFEIVELPEYDIVNELDEMVDIRETISR